MSDLPGTGIIILMIILGLFFVVMIAIISIPLGIAGGYLNLAVNTVSAPNYATNLAWFKQQETAIEQLSSQICSAKQTVAEFSQTYGNPSTWDDNTQNNYQQDIFVRDGYIAKYNALVADYNARRSNWIQSFGRDATPPADYSQFYLTTCN